MAGMILRKTGVVLLTILKGLLHAGLIILKLLFGGLKFILNAVACFGCKGAVVFGWDSCT